jgi:hypothetical protein
MAVEVRSRSIIYRLKVELTVLAEELDWGARGRPKVTHRFSSGTTGPMAMSFSEMVHPTPPRCHMSHVSLRSLARLVALDLP